MARGGSTARFKRCTHEPMEVKLVIDRERNEVLYAEAGVEFIDFLFGLVSLPLSSIISMHVKDSMVGSVVKLYESIEKMEDSFFSVSRWVRAELLHPDLPSTFLDLAECGRRRTRGVRKECKDRSGMVYMITNQLEVLTMSTATIISLMKSSNVCMENIEEGMVTVGLNEKIGILAAILSSKNAFTEVFLSAKEKRVHHQSPTIPLFQRGVNQLNSEKNARSARSPASRRPTRRAVWSEPSIPRRRGRGWMSSGPGPGPARNTRSSSVPTSRTRRCRGQTRSTSVRSSLNKHRHSGRISGRGRGGSRRRLASVRGRAQSQSHSSEKSDDEMMVESEVKLENEDKFSYSVPEHIMPHFADNPFAPSVQSPPHMSTNLT